MLVQIIDCQTLLVCFLGGEAYLQNGDEEIYLNSETDSSAITVKEAKEILKSRQAESDNQ